MLKSLEYRPDIDGLRAIAVLAVLFYHATPTALPGGFLGVDIFFVISGFLITKIIIREYSSGVFSVSNFYIRRINRLFPALILVIVCALGFGSLTLFAKEYEHLGRHAVSAILFILNFRLINESGYFDVASHAKPLLHLWSLSIEEQFYLIWPLLITLALRLGIRMSWVCSIAIAALLVLAMNLNARNPDGAYFHPAARFWELLIGASLAFTEQAKEQNPPLISRTRLFHANIISLIGILSITWSFLLWDKSHRHPGIWTLLPTLGAAAIIYNKQTLISKALSLKPLVWIGLISYPLYLWHWPILSYIRIMESGKPPGAYISAGILLSIILAGATYVLLERPLRARKTPKKTALALAVLMLGLLLASQLIVARNGFPDRSAVQYAKAAEAQLKREPRQDDRCLRRFGAHPPVYCREQGQNGPFIVITGDSHAHVLFPGIAQAAGALGYSTLLLANSGCPPLDGAVTGRNETERAACAASIENILQAIEAEHEIAGIIIASRGPQYIEGTGFGPAEAHYNHPPIASKTAGSLAQSPAEVFQAGLRRTIERLHNKTPLIAYMLQVPELGVPARDCLNRPLTLSTASSCTVEYEVYQARMKSYREIIRSIQSALPYLKLIDPEPVFCDATRCTGYIDSELLYADDNHLSVMGSMRVAPLIMSILNLSAVNNPPEPGRMP